LRRRDCLAALSGWRFSAAIVTARSLIRTTLNEPDETGLGNQKLQLRNPGCSRCESEAGMRVD